MAKTLARYHRQMLLTGFGESGQRKLEGSRAVVLGCGALGTVIADTLARAGVGHLVLIDRDFVELTNLQRQVLFDDTMRPRTRCRRSEAAKLKLARDQLAMSVTAVRGRRECHEHRAARRGADVLLDGVDNFETRYLANDCAVKRGIPYVYGGAVGTVGSAFTILPHTARGGAAWEGAGETAAHTVPALSLRGGAAARHRRYLRHGRRDCAGRRDRRELRGWRGAQDPDGQFRSSVQDAPDLRPLGEHLRQLEVTRAYDDGDCPCCKHRRFEYLDGTLGSGTTALCGRDAVQIRQRREADDVDLAEIAGRLEAHGDVKVNAFMLRARLLDRGRPYEITLFPDGRAIVKGTHEPNVARALYAKFIGS